MRRFINWNDLGALKKLKKNYDITLNMDLAEPSPPTSPRLFAGASFSNKGKKIEKKQPQPQMMMASYSRLD